MTSICVYGAASNNIDQEYIKTVEHLGEEMARRGYRLVYGGGATGLMGAVARGMDKLGGHIIGVVPQFMDEFEELYESNHIITTQTMAERKSTMENNSDAFIIVPGGVGTFDEFFQILTLKELQQLGDKPIIVYNVGGYYNELQAMMIAANKKGFFRPALMNMYHFCNTEEEVFEAIESEIPDKAE